jgi:hypothetical protein
VQVLLLALVCGACDDDDTSNTASSTAGEGKGTVLTTWKAAVVGARVYLVPVEQVSTSAITAAGVLAGDTETFDEPLEDLVASSAAASFPQAVTDAAGQFSIPLSDTTRKYYAYVDTTGATPPTLFPGGSASRVAPRDGLQDLHRLGDG